MAGRIGSTGAAKTIQRLTGTPGLNATLAMLTLPNSAGTGMLSIAQTRAENVAADIAERGAAVQYPVVQVYCEKVVNTLAEKFQTFSGTVQMAIEIRHSQDQLDGLEAALEIYADAVMQVLDGSRGDWGDGMYYAGGYQVVFSAVKRGGKNYLQAARVTFEIGVGVN
jgi:hypothetical protein